MNVFHVINRFIATVGGVLLVAYEFSRIYKSYLNQGHIKTYMLDNPYIQFSTFILLSFAFLFLNIFSCTKNRHSNILRGFLGCFLVTYALMFFLNQAHICSIYYQRGSPKLRVAIYLCLFMFLYFCSLCIECYNSLSKEKIDKKKKKEQGSIKIEV
ncbi:conserved Plasmodium protein, unknown function [Plasmodium ovale]|uniref:Uncharacterized protein n=1 Tax=Plasmodium ovale TaxID=36330 RepID=A0A1D3U8K0_PLAOA|nr:conserved Plasmodium protein, unknown function [Plasmodium ovale]